MREEDAFAWRTRKRAERVRLRGTGRMSHVCVFARPAPASQSAGNQLRSGRKGAAAGEARRRWRFACAPQIVLGVSRSARQLGSWRRPQASAAKSVAKSLLVRRRFNGGGRLIGGRSSGGRNNKQKALWTFWQRARLAHFD